MQASVLYDPCIPVGKPAGATNASFPSLPQPTSAHKKTSILMIEVLTPGGFEPPLPE